MGTRRALADISEHGRALAVYPARWLARDQRSTFLALDVLLSDASLDPLQSPFDSNLRRVLIDETLDATANEGFGDSQGARDRRSLPELAVRSPRIVRSSVLRDTPNRSASSPTFIPRNASAAWTLRPH
jgi:hypothetical protein